jgi:hypothetical protein
MNMARTRRSHGGLPVLVAVVAAFVTTSTALGQEGTNETTLTGTVASSTRSTLVVRNANGQHQLFVFDRDTTRPALLPAGSQVRVVSIPGEELGVRVATEVAIVQSGQRSASREESPSSATANVEASPVIPREVFRSDTGLNILGGVRFRRGTFVELKTTVYSNPAPTLRRLFGYNF